MVLESNFWTIFRLLYVSKEMFETSCPNLRFMLNNCYVHQLIDFVKIKDLCVSIEKPYMLLPSRIHCFGPYFKFVLYYKFTNNYFAIWGPTTVNFCNSRSWVFLRVDPPGT